jgi:hypothetical protein
MLVFVDEAGDTGLKIEKGSSRYFIVTLLMFEDHEEAAAADTRISLLRRELGLPMEYEFHFNETPERIKGAFFDAIVPYNFFYFAIVINKAKLYGPGFKVRESFYKYATSLVFENAKQYLSDAIVVFDGSGSREMNYPAASRGVSPSGLARHSVLDTESSRAFWIPASAGMTNSRQAAGNEPSRIQAATQKLSRQEGERA